MKVCQWGSDWTTPVQMKNGVTKHEICMKEKSDEKEGNERETMLHPASTDWVIVAKQEV